MTFILICPPHRHYGLPARELWILEISRCRTRPESADDANRHGRAVLSTGPAFRKTRSSHSRHAAAFRDLTGEGARDRAAGHTPSAPPGTGRGPAARTEPRANRRRRQTGRATWAATSANTGAPPTPPQAPRSDRGTRFQKPPDYFVTSVTTNSALGRPDSRKPGTGQMRLVHFERDMSRADHGGIRPARRFRPVVGHSGLSDGPTEAHTLSEPGPARLRELFKRRPALRAEVVTTPIAPTWRRF